MSGNILWKNNIEEQGMEGESKSEEPFLKIETIWSETEENFQNMTIKEENISDVEPEDLLQDQQQASTDYVTCQKSKNKSPVKTDNQQKQAPEESNAIVRNEVDVKKIKPKGNVDKMKSCLHDVKNFKIVKKRLRCSDCKAILCPECYASINSTLHTHLSKSDNNNRFLYPCKLCSMIFKSKCALQAHVRIHLLDTPYVCPDCGVIYNNIYFLSLHLINKCYHVYKIVKSGCKFCLSQSIAPKDYIAHIEQAHIKPIYKCSHCGLMFESKLQISTHLRASHKNQKVMSLSYFCCSMCGNLIISKNIYAKHIKYHQEFSAAFHTAYLCSCGSTFNTATSFRSHFKNCSKRGILPPQWTYLQVTLKTHEMLQANSVIQGKALHQSESALPSNTGSNNDLTLGQRKISSDLFEDADSSDDFDELSEETSRNNSNDGDLFDQENNSSREKEEQGTLFCATSAILNRTENRNLDNTNKANEAKGADLLEDNSEVSFDDQRSNLIKTSENVDKNYVGTTEEKREKAKELSLDTNLISEKSNLTPNAQSVGQASLESQDENHSQGALEKVRENVEQNGRVSERSLKIVYDHIPCDHLGYLKIQQRSELLDKTLRKDSTEAIEFPEGTLASGPGSENYLITSVLDEKTGFMRTKKVLIQKSHVENVNGDYVILDPLENPDAMPNIQTREIQKTKSSTFFSCPFCSVLFPKHYSSFQRFRLHLECYHPEAALDITVDRTEIPKSQTPFTSITISDDNYSDNDSYDFDDIDLQTRLNSLRESNKEEEACKNTSSVSCENQQGEDKDRTKKRSTSVDCDGQNNRIGRSDFETKLRSCKNCENGESENTGQNSDKNYLKMINIRRNSFNRNINENSRAAFKPVSTAAAQPKNFDLIEGNILSRDSRESDIGIPERELNSGNFRNFTDEDNSESLDSENSLKPLDSNKNDGGIIFKSEENEPLKRNNILHRKQISILNHKRKKICEDTFLGVAGTNELEEEIRDEKRQPINLGSDSLGSCTRTTQEKEFYLKSSPDQSKNQTAETAAESYSPEKLDSEEIRGGNRSAERRNSRRESDVWSEFYKTLKIAETFKKTKVKNKNRAGGEEGASILTNYTNKRIVKKPKRYRESSDSEDSEDGKQSPSFSKSFENKLDQEEDEIYVKKKRLIRRLENVDYRILDYVFKLLERKQKNHALAKKNGEGSVKGCKKRLSNGVRMPGRPLKHCAENYEVALNYGNSGERYINIFDADEVEWELQAGSCFEEKNVDKKRGRPKKTDPLMVKERRRSDLEREVNFIEKNFEADENDFFTNKRKRKLSTKLQYYKKMSVNAEKNDFSSGQVITTKSSEAEKKLTCAVCKESYQKELEFKEHIQSHRMDDNNHQCMECGECFVVRPSLEKHLHAFHKIKDVQKYIEENECSIAEKPDEVDAEPLKENQCKVCRDEFANVHDLNKHFRIHGMAFLRQFKKDTKAN